MPAETPDDEPALSVEHVDVTYGHAVLALQTVSLTVPPGGVVALLGADGAGRTTLLRAPSGTLRLHRGAVTAGRIRSGDTALDGRDPVAAVRAAVAVSAAAIGAVFALFRFTGWGLSLRAAAEDT